MSKENDLAIAREVYDAFNSRDVERAMRIATDDLEIELVPFGRSFRGPAGLREFMEGWIEPFPDARVEITNMVASEDGRVAAEFIGRGTHTGTLKTPAGDVAPTNRQAEGRYCEVMEMRDGKVARLRSYFDGATMMRQLGLMPEPGAAGVPSPS
jgi:steroid delta-isomerase-like uncharacterized protein